MGEEVTVVAIPGPDGARMARIHRLIEDRAGGGSVTVGHLCAACVAAVGVDGAALWLAGAPDQRALLHATDDVARDLDDTQFTLGEGPCMQAWTERTTVLAADLASPRDADRWPMFTPAAIAAGAGAVFAFPLQSGAIRVGGLVLYRARPGRLSAEQLADALAFATAGFTLVLHRTRTASNGSDGQAWPFDGLGDGRAEVYQATGMLSVQLGVSLEEALLRLRAHAFTSQLGITEAARLVVDRRVRIGDDDQ